ncbi:uncharacterized protein LTR77_007990 [Saxophila tyrrhenica]|uniref:FAD-binding PCMH-type domain-containing protein n=1 Tax=Saxophila tyrrhenica TaxID=1690608 RepID=A0AAV9P2B4_9PEZI|nr:hypothetical protein LTR77_007990 [Saxophila tyrrhenica]
MGPWLLLLSSVAGGLAAATGKAKGNCKCAPTDACWPSDGLWNSLNATTKGHLIKTEPEAISCYPGPKQDAERCEVVDASWTLQSFQSSSPVGLSYPINETCPPINVTAGETPGTCTLGTNPWYAVSASSTSDVATAIKFAKNHNVRLVIKDTGHDILGRSTGYGSLEIWVRSLRTGLTFQPKYKSSCKTSAWTGAAITVGGGYTFNDVYKVAKANNVVVVGGGTPSVGALGGWMQGGGHGPASRQFGLGADQVLEAEVVTADGKVITASPCSNSDVYWAIRGGGPGTYGVVTKTVIKAYPMVNVQVQHVAIAPLSDNTSALLDAIAILWEAYPDLNDAGYAGYGTWSISQPTPLFATFTAGYVHGFYTFDKTVSYAKSTFEPTLQKLLPYNGTSLFISVDYVSYPDYWSFYNTESGVEPPVGTGSALSSRLFSRSAVQDDTAGLRSMLDVIAGTPEQYTSNNFELVSGGANFEKPDDYSALLPAWRISYFNNIVARGWAPDATQAEKDAVQRDISFTKVGAMEKQAPDTGVYMNEGDRLDPNYKQDYYGEHYDRLASIKEKVDPNGVFYCPTCVGSDEWKEDSTGRLCRV